MHQDKLTIREIISKLDNVTFDQLNLWLKKGLFPYEVIDNRGTRVISRSEIDRIRYAAEFLSNKTNTIELLKRQWLIEKNAGEIPNEISDQNDLDEDHQPEVKVLKSFSKEIEEHLIALQYEEIKRLKDEKDELLALIEEKEQEITALSLENARLQALVIQKEEDADSEVSVEEAEIPQNKEDIIKKLEDLAHDKKEELEITMEKHSFLSHLFPWNWFKKKEKTS